jgi:cyclic pyranopterin phosphate synthase|tara:strand:- start:462 stop:944 length:483 start_codon:yes stop_codon:yes gene_type:complete
MKEDKKITHLNQKGEANMVNITSKEMSDRVAVAFGTIEMKKETLNLLKENAFEKGDVLSIARVAGIMAAKQTPTLIPLCHPLSITQAAIDFDINEEKNLLKIKSTIKTHGKTGVEMEALTAVSIAALTVYDMCKSVDKGMKINIGLVSKKGGKSGDIYLN